MKQALSILLALLLLLLPALSAHASAPIENRYTFTPLTEGSTITSEAAYLVYHAISGAETPRIANLFGSFLSFSRTAGGGYRYRYSLDSFGRITICLDVTHGSLSISEAGSFDDLKAHLQAPIFDAFGDVTESSDLVRLTSEISGTFRIGIFHYRYENGLLQSIETEIDGYTLCITVEEGFSAIVDHEYRFRYVMSYWVESLSRDFRDSLRKGVIKEYDLLITDQSVYKELFESGMLPKNLPSAEHFEAFGDFVGFLLPGYYLGNLSAYAYLLAPTRRVEDWIVISNISVDPIFGLDTTIDRCTPPFAKADSILSLAEPQDAVYIEDSLRYTYQDGCLVSVSYFDHERDIPGSSILPACGFASLSIESGHPLSELIHPTTTKRFLEGWFTSYVPPEPDTFPYFVPVIICLLIAFILIPIVSQRMLFPKQATEDVTKEPTPPTPPESPHAPSEPIPPEPIPPEQPKEEEPPFVPRYTQDPSVWQRQSDDTDA